MRLALLSLALLSACSTGPEVRVMSAFSQGHGVIVAPDKVLTVNHLIKPFGSPVWVALGESVYPASIEKVYPRNGSWESHVLLSVDLPPLGGYEIAELDEIRKGDSGTPIYARGKVIGLISARDRFGNPIITRVKE